MIFRYPLQILEHHLDTFGHVNNAVYFELYEQARWEWITKNGYGLDVIKTLGQGPVILSIECKFLKELRLRDEIIIETECTEIRKATQTVLQRMRNHAGDVCNEATFTFGLFDTTKRKLITPTDRWIRALKGE